MKNRTIAAFLALEDAIKTNPDAVKCCTTLKVAVVADLAEHAAATSTYGRGSGAFGETVGGRAVLERAWAADPKRTEMDLIAAGRRDLAAELGNWWLAEEHRRRVAGRSMAAMLAGARARNLAVRANAGLEDPPVE
jgi:hypothetical protein